MDTLVVRESRSSLAGVVMAVAIEGMSVGEAHALMSHGLTGAPRGLKLPHSSALHSPLGQLGHGHASRAVQHELRGVQNGSPTDPAAPSASGSPASTASAPASAAEPQASAAPSPTPAPAPAGVPAAETPATPEPVAPPVHACAAQTWPDQHGGASASPVNAPATPEPAPPNPGAQHVDGGAVPAWPDQQAGGAAPASGAAAGTGAIGADGAPGALAALLESPQLSAPPAVRTFLTSGGADPRMVSVLDSALANHTIGLGQVEAVSDPVHVQAIDIVSVDGQPVGPDNLAARDLVTEIAALDPSVRPSQIGTPWPIQSPGFFSDAGAANRLHLAFEMPGTD